MKEHNDKSHPLIAKAEETLRMIHEADGTQPIGADYWRAKARYFAEEILRAPVSAIVPSHDDLIRNARSWATACEFEQSSGAFMAAQLFAKEVLRLNGSSDDGDAWRTWAGGNCPVRPEDKVEVRFRDGTEHKGHLADFWVWTHSGEGDDVVAYRLARVDRTTERK